MSTAGGGLGPGAEFDLIRQMLSAAAAAAAAATAEASLDGPLGGPPRPAPGSGGDAWVELGAGDDAALVCGTRMALSSDLSVEGVHFRSQWMSAREIGYRATMAALSDLAAMAAQPLGALLSLAIDTERARAWAPEIATGAGEAVGRYGGVLLGGDLSRTPPGAPAVLDLMVAGDVEYPLLRSGSRPGDSVWVTGSLGGAAAAVELWTEQEVDPPQPLRERFARPAARIAEARWLARTRAVHAVIDVSDGLAADVAHLASAAGVRVQIDADAVPVDAVAERTLGSARALTLALTGGEDYELAFTAPPAALAVVRDEFQDRFGLAVTRVGEVTSGAGLDILGFDLAGGRPSGWSHFTNDVEDDR